MSGATSSVLIAIAIPVCFAMMAPFATGARKAAASGRDTAVSVFVILAFAVLLLDVAAASLAAAWGLGAIGLVKGAILLTGAFAFAGAAFGLVRGLRSGKAVNEGS